MHRSSPGKSDSTLETWAPICEVCNKDYEDTFSEKSAVLSPVCPKDIQIPVLTGICQLYGAPKG